MKKAELISVLKSACRGCGKPLLPANETLADGCPCNSPRGINHGIVPRHTCTCSECDPAGTGGARAPAGNFISDRAHLEALEGAGEAGFAPVGWLYESVMSGLVVKGLAEKRGAAYVLSKDGAAELRLQRSTKP